MEAHGLRVLVVDDDDHIRISLADALTNACFSVSTTSDGKQAIEEIVRQRFDAIITDYQMPLMNGLELLAFVRRHSSSTPVIVISGAGPVIEQIALDRGAFAFIPKPFSPRTVLEMVHLAAQIGREQS